MLSEESKLRLDELKVREEQLNDTLHQRRNQLHEMTGKTSTVVREMASEQHKTEDLRKQAKQSEQAQLQVDLLEKMLKLLGSYKQSLKIKQREVLENYFNRNIKTLLDSNHLISGIEIDESFQFKLLHSNGSAIAMSSISAGMKQLMATALIWALKDACGKQLPVVIDTPLGRIDRQHQDNLLGRYYPYAAKQVILLPTDSEVDERKRTLLEPYIYREYHLYNEEGDKSRIEQMQPAARIING